MIFYLLLLCNMLMCLSISVITPFFPPFALDFGVGQETIGYIISANPLGAFFATLILGKIMNERNRVNFMIIGLLMQATGMFGFASTYVISKVWLFISVSTLSRILSGMGAAFFTTPFYAIIPIMYPTQIERYAALAEMGAGFGFFIGPIFGSLLYSLGGYTFPFIFFGGLVFIIAPLLFILLKRKEVRDSRSFLIEKMKEEDDMRYASQRSPKKNLLKMSIENSWPGMVARFRKESEQVNLNTSKGLLVRYSTELLQLGYLKLLSHYKIFINYIMVIAVNFVIMYFAPTFAAFLEQQYNIGSNEVGFYMSLYAFTYLIGCIMILKIKNYKQLYIFIFTFVLGIGFYFQGPTDMLFPLEPNIYIVLGAQAVAGFAISFLFILTLPYLNELVTSHSRNEQECANMASALYNNGMSVGELLGPLISGILTQQFGFPDASAYVGFALLGLSILYLPILLY